MPGTWSIYVVPAVACTPAGSTTVTTPAPPGRRTPSSPTLFDKRSLPIRKAALIHDHPHTRIGRCNLALLKNVL